MFGKKEKNNTEPEQPVTARIETMPGAFYGGADPVIYQNNLGGKSELSTPATVTPPPTVPKPPVVPPKAQTPRPVAAPTSDKASLQKPPLAPPSSNKKIILIGGIVFLLFLGVLGYYLYPVIMGTSETPPEQIATTTTTFEASPITNPIVPTTTPPVIETPTTTPTTTPVQRGGGTLTLPSISYATSRDDDADALTTREEEVFITDPEVWDTDKDGYYDGLEIANLYNPKGIAPQKIIDSGLVREYVNPVYQYRFYYPNSWRVDAVAQDYTDILISADSGDYIEIRVFPKESNVSFANWFAATLPGENFLSLSTFSNRFQVPGYKRADNQVGFFETPNAIYSVIYFYGEEKNLYPHIMEMVMQSFRPTRGEFELPVQPVLPGIVVPTTTPMVTTTPITPSTTPAEDTPAVTSSTEPVIEPDPSTPSPETPSDTTP